MRKKKKATDILIVIGSNKDIEKLEKHLLFTGE